MKKHRITAALCVFALGLTPLGAVPITIASANEEVAYAGERHITITKDNEKWWTEEKIYCDELFGDVDPADVVGIEFEGSSDVKFLVVYNEINSEEAKIWEGKTSYRLSAEDVAAIDYNNFNFGLVLSTGNVGDSTDISWNILVDNGEEPYDPDSSTPDPDPPTPYEPTVDVEFPYYIDAEYGYKGDWAYDGSIPLSVIDSIPNDMVMAVTVDYTLCEDYDEYLFIPQSNTKGKPSIFDTHNKYDSIYGIDLKSSLTDDEYENHISNIGAPLLQNDGSIAVFPSGGYEQSCTFYINNTGLEYLRSQAYQNNGSGGLTFLQNGIDINSIFIDCYDDYLISNDVDYEIDENISFNDPFTFKVTDDEFTECRSAKILLSGTNTPDREDLAFWNDWCSYYIKVTQPDGKKYYYAVAGPEVTWDVCCRFEDNKILINCSDLIRTDKDTGKVTVSVPYTNGSKIDIVALDWGDDEFTEEAKNSPYINVNNILLSKDEPKNPPAKTIDVSNKNERKYIINDNISCEQSAEFYVSKNTDLGFTCRSATLELNGLKTDKDYDYEGTYWNDWCRYTIVVTDAKKNKKYYVVSGPEVNWDEVIKPCGDYELIVPNSQMIKTDRKTGKVSVTIPYVQGDTIEVKALSWSEDMYEDICDEPYIYLSSITLSDKKATSVYGAEFCPDISVNGAVTLSKKEFKSLGEDIRVPVPIVTFYGIELINGVDYKTTYALTDDMKTAYIMVKGINDFYGEITTKYVINTGITRGDVNSDGKLNMKDYAKLKQYMNDKTVKINESVADLNKDGKINMKDLALLQRLINGWEI